MSGRNPPLYSVCVLALLIAMQGYQTKQRQNCIGSRKGLDGGVSTIILPYLILLAIKQVTVVTD